MATAASQKWVFDSIGRIPWSGPVIDLGAGGNAAWYMGLFGNEVYKTLDLEQNKSNNIDFIADLCTMPEIPSNSYGVALLLDTLEHIPFPILAFKEAARILKPKGIFICTTVAAWEQHDHPVDYWRFLADGLRFLCSASGLTPFYVGYKKIGEEGRLTCNISAVKNP